MVDWGRHASLYSVDWYRAIRLDVERSSLAPEPWATDLALPMFRYADLDESQANGQAKVVGFLSDVYFEFEDMFNRLFMIQTKRAKVEA